MDELTRKQAYIEGELSAEEQKEFEADLSVPERDELARDQEFCKELYRRLKEGPDCPCGVWEDLKARMGADCDKPAKVDASVPNCPTKKFRWRIVAVAAAVLFQTILLGIVITKRKPASTFTMGEGFAFYSDTKRFASLADERCSYNGLCCVLRDYGFPGLVVLSPDKAKHPLTPLGISCREVGGAKYAQIFFECCGKPMVAVVSSRDKTVDLNKKQWQNLEDFHMSSKVVGNYRITVAGPHVSDGVLSLFSAKPRS